jgi:hypothetical protein
MIWQNDAGEESPIEKRGKPFAPLYRLGGDVLIAG